MSVEIRAVNEINIYLTEGDVQSILNRLRAKKCGDDTIIWEHHTELNKVPLRIFMKVQQ
jgi:hypothetical protein